jgi:iron-sulfur cluster assembly protein
MEAQTQQKITKDMYIGEIIAQYPQVASVVQRYGLHCVGCHVSYHETLEEGALGHGMSEEDVQNLVKDMNSVINTPKKEGLELTNSAIEKFKDLMKKENKEGFALRVSVIPGGCSGFSYEMSFVEKKEENDLEIQAQDLKVYVDKESLEFLKGIKIDYLDTLHESGFKIENPNINSSCGCGKSFS